MKELAGLPSLQPNRKPVCIGGSSGLAGDSISSTVKSSIIVQIFKANLA
jgi:hypothetical protein